MTWKYRWPTAEEARAHAEAYGRDGRGAWLYKMADEGYPAVAPLCDQDYVSSRNPAACRPIDLDGNPVPWPGEDDA